jgi:formylmethanofuran dehydrogenase subunit B
LIVIGTPDDALRRRATLVLPAAVPGIESTGTTFRGDGTVSLGWRPPFQQTAAASIGQVLLALGDQVQARRISQC